MGRRETGSSEARRNKMATVIQLDHRLTTPVYDPAYAAKMLELSTARVRRWLLGYSFKYHPRMGGVIRRDKTPLVQRGQETDPRASFVDLMELYFAKAFLDHGISLNRMRKAV